LSPPSATIAPVHSAAMDGPTVSPARLTITARSGSILVRAVAGAEIAAEGARVERDDDGSFRIESASGHMEVTCPEGTDLILGTSSGKVRIAGRLGDVRVTASSGRVDLESARRVDVRARSGSVEVAECEGDCHVVAVSGRIQIGRAGRVDLKAVSGTIVAEAVAGGRVRTTSGNVSIGLALAADLDIRAVSSSITVEVPTGVAPDMQLRTRSGSVRKEVEKGHDCVISAHTVSGSITIR
jgi:DUF4097 and DUF4098 domain-containing protein YvlB